MSQLPNFQIITSNRKVQKEAESVFKKISEGLEKFDECWERVHEAQNPQQREKSEGELKKEIKRLQRNRETIKIWIGGNDFKDKRILKETRRRIETKMEKFKLYEKESKMKAYSKEGMKRAKRKPMSKEMEEIRKWIDDTVQSLEELGVQYEKEEQELRDSGKTDTEEFESVEHFVEFNKLYVSHLKLCERLLEEKRISISKVEEIKEGVEYVLTDHEEPTFFPDESLFEDIIAAEKGPLMDDNKDSGKAAVIFSKMQQRSPPPAAGRGGVVSTGGSDPLQINKPRSRKAEKRVSSAKSSVKKKTPPPSASPASGGSSLNLSSKKEPPLLSMRPRRIAKGPEKKKAKVPGNTSGGPESQGQGSGSSISGGNVTGVKAVVKKRKNSNDLRINPPAKKPVVNKWAMGTETQKNWGPPRAGANFLTKSKTRQTPQSASTPPVGTSGKTKSGESKDQQLLSVQTSLPKKANTPGPSLYSRGGDKAGGQQQPGSQSAKAELYFPYAKKDFGGRQGLGVQGDKTFLDSGDSSSRMLGRQGIPQVKVKHIKPQYHGLGNPTTLYGIGNSPQIYGVGGPGGGRHLPRGMKSLTLQQQNVHQIRKIEMREMREQESLGVDKNLLQLSMETQPKSLDTSEPHVRYDPLNPIKTPDCFPQHPHPLFSNPLMFQNFDTDTLFYCFYFQQGTFQQYLAANELKRQSWRYHKKYLTWFQRHDQPTHTTNEFEMGTYVYFDYDALGWCQRIKRGFRFEYQYLENKQSLGK